jgi:hypothetical protein
MSGAKREVRTVGKSKEAVAREVLERELKN